MARERAKSMDQSSFWTVDATGPPRKLCRPTMASPEPGGMLRFLRFQGFIRGMSAKENKVLEKVFFAQAKFLQ